MYLYIIICLIFIAVGIYYNQKPLKDYLKILKLSGRAVTDFTRNNNQPLTMINIGITGLAALLIILILDVHMNGPVFGGLLTIVGFSAFGKHPRNVLPPMIGVLIMILLFNMELSVILVLAIIFASALAPLSGEYGAVIGVLSGMLHLPIAISLGQLHGGVLLYSNGFAAAFTAVIMLTIIQTFKRRDRHATT